MPSIEELSREVEEGKAKPVVESTESKKAAEDRQIEAFIWLNALQEYDEKLARLIGHSSDSIRDRTWPVIQSIRNVMSELSRIYNVKHKEEK